MHLEQARIIELEQTIGELITYLRRLPANPETYHQANKSEAILNKNVESLATFTGAQFLPYGLAIIGVNVTGSVVTVKTQDIGDKPEEWQRQHYASLYQSLVRGFSVPVSSTPFDDWNTFFTPVIKQSD